RRRTLVFLEATHHFVAPCARHAAVQEQRFEAEHARELGDQALAHLTVLSEQQRSISRRNRLFQHLDRTLQFAGTAVQRSGLAEVLSRVIADLLERGQQREHLAAPFDACGAFDATHGVVERRLVQRRLLARERAQHFHLLLGRQVLNHGRIALQAPQDERPDEPAQTLGDLVLPVALYRDRIVASERGLRSEQARIQILEDRPELRQPVLYRRAGQRDAELRAQIARRLRRA